MKDIRARFHEALKRDLLSHAYILEGGDAKSRRDIAMDLAMLLLCDQRNAHASHGRMPCQECASCKKALSGEHPDLFVIEPEKGMIRLEAVKKLISALKYPPFEAGMRAVILFEGDKMNPEAANTLLKTLEEPPPKNVFIITTASRHLLLPTICSRCQTLIMAKGDASLISQKTEGKDRFLQLLKDMAVSDTDGLDEERALSLREGIFEVLRLYYIENKKALSAARAFTIAKEVSKEPLLFSIVIQCLKSISRDVLFLRQHLDGSAPQDLLINEDKADLLKIIASFFNDVDLFEHTFRLQELENMVRRGINLEYAINSVILFWFGEYG